MGLFDMVGGGAMGLLHMMRSGANAVVNRAMPVPSAYDGLISPEDIETARRRGVLGFGASLLGNSGPTGPALGQAINAGVDTYDQGMQGALQQGNIATQLGEQKRIRAVRQKIAEQYPQAPNESEEQTAGRLQKIFAALVQGGDMEGAGKVGEVVKVLGANRAKALQHIDAGDHIEITDPVTGQPVRSIPKVAPPKAPGTEQYEWFQKKDGSTVYLPKAEGSRLGLQKPTVTSGFGFGPGGPVGAMRALSAIEGMNDADTKMKRFELLVASKSANLNDFDYFRGQLATLYNDAAQQTGIMGHIVPFFGTMSGAAVLARLNRTNPDLANYLQAASQWALEESALSNRPSDFRTKMDEFVSAIKPDAKVQSIHDLWQSRHVRLKGFQKGVPTLRRLLERAANLPATPGTVEGPESP